MVQPPASEPPIGGYPQPGPVAPGYLYQLGDIGVTADTIVTHRGTAPLAGSQWYLANYTRYEQKIPTWAIVMAVVFATLCLLGLLFLLVKEPKITGHMEITVQSGSFQHATYVLVVDEGHVHWITSQVSQIQAYAASLG